MPMSVPTALTGGEEKSAASQPGGDVQSEGPCVRLCTLGWPSLREPFTWRIVWLMFSSIKYGLTPYVLSPLLSRPTVCPTAGHPDGYCSAGQHTQHILFLRVMLERLDVHALGLK